LQHILCIFVIPAHSNAESLNRRCNAAKELLHGFRLTGLGTFN